MKPTQNEASNILDKIDSYIEDADYESIAKELNECCGKNGRVDIKLGEDGFYFHLFFTSISARKSVVALAGNRFKHLYLKSITEKQMPTKNGLYALKLTANQSQGLLVFPDDERYFEEVKEALTCIRNAVNAAYLQTLKPSLEDVEVINKISKIRHFEIVASLLDDLSGQHGHVEINLIKNAYQLHLIFDSEIRRNEIMKTLPFKLSENYASFRFKTSQITKDNNLYALKLSKNQSVALFGKNPGDPWELKSGQNILKDLKTMLLPPLPLPEVPASPILPNLATINDKKTKFATDAIITLIEFAEKADPEDSESIIIAYIRAFSNIAATAGKLSEQVEDMKFKHFLDGSIDKSYTLLYPLVKSFSLHEIIHMVEIYQLLSPHFNGHLHNSPLKTTLQSLFQSQGMFQTLYMLRNGIRTLLYHAAEKGHFDCIKYLVPMMQESGQQHLLLYTNPDDPTKQTILHCAAGCGHIDIVKYLVEICPKLVGEKDCNSKIATVYASKNGHVETAKYLIENFSKLKNSGVIKDVKENSNDIKLATAFTSHLKALSESVHDIKHHDFNKFIRKNKELLTKNSKLIDTRIDGGKYAGGTLLTIAAAIGSHEIVDFLLEIHPTAAIGVPLSSGIDKGATAAWYMAKFAKWKTLQTMLEANPQINVHAPMHDLNSGMTLSGFVAMMQQRDIVKTMLTNNPEIDVNTGILETPYRGKITPSKSTPLSKLEQRRLQNSKKTPSFVDSANESNEESMPEIAFKPLKECTKAKVKIVAAEKLTLTLQTIEPPPPLQNPIDLKPRPQQEASLPPLEPLDIASRPKKSKTLERKPSVRELKIGTPTPKSDPESIIDLASTSRDKKKSTLKKALDTVKTRFSNDKDSTQSQDKSESRKVKKSSLAAESSSMVDSTTAQSNSIASSFEDSCTSSFESNDPDAPRSLKAEARRNARAALEREERKSKLREKRKSLTVQTPGSTDRAEPKFLERKNSTIAIKALQGPDILINDELSSMSSMTEETSESEKPTKLLSKRLVRRISEIDLTQRKSINLDESLITSTLKAYQVQELIKYRKSKRKNTITATIKNKMPGSEDSPALVIHTHSDPIAWYKKPEVVEDFCNFVEACKLSLTNRDNLPPAEKH